MKAIKGICVALCTPFTENGEAVDETALRDHIDSMIEGGLKTILVCGGTGEFAYLRPQERKRIAEIAADQINGRAALMVHTSAINTADAVEYARHAEDAGADCLLVLPPYFEGPDDAGVYYHYEKISQAINIPIMAYNIPTHSGIDITPEFFRRLREIENVRFIKDSTGDIIRIQELLADGVQVFNGCDPNTLFALMAGCPGAVWGAPNAMPKEASELYDLVTSDKLLEAKNLWSRMLPANLFFWSHVYNATVKAGTNLTGRKVGPCRKPVQPLSDSEMEELKCVFEPLMR